MGRKEEYKLQNEQFMQALRAEADVYELPCGILYKVEVCLDYIFGKHQVMVFLAGWKFDEAGHFGVGLLHHEVKRLPGFC